MPDTPNTPFAALGGEEEAVERLCRRFYELMSTLPEAEKIRAMHKGDLEPMIDKLTTFLTGWMGGPSRYSEKFGRVIIPSAHKPFPIGPDEVNVWLLCMQTALEEEPLDPEWVERIMTSMRQMAEMCRNLD